MKSWRTWILLWITLMKTIFILGSWRKEGWSFWMSRIHQQLSEEFLEAIGRIWKSAAVRRFVRSNLKNLITVSFFTKLHLRRRRRRTRKEVRFQVVNKKKAEYLELPSVYFFRTAVRIKNFFKRRRILFCISWYSKIQMYFNIAAAENSSHNYNNYVIQHKRFI